MICILIVYLIGILFTTVTITNSNIPNVNPQPGSPDRKPNPSNISPLWALVWPFFWLKTIPIFIALHREQKSKERN